MDLRKLKKLIDLVEESGIAELEITEGEEKVRISRGGAHAVAGTQMVTQAVTAAPAPVSPLRVVPHKNRLPHGYEVCNLVSGCL